MGIFNDGLESLNIDISFDQRRGKDKSRKMNPIIVIKELELPAFEMNTEEVNLSGDCINIEKLQMKKEPLYNKKQEIKIKNFRISGFGLSIGKPKAE